MRNCIVIFVLVCVAMLLQGCTMWREHAVNKWADATGGEGLERRFWNEVKNKNWNELHRDIIVVTYSITLRGTRAGQPLPVAPIRRMAVWQQQKSGWMKIADSEIGSLK